VRNRKHTGQRAARSLKLPKVRPLTFRAQSGSACALWSGHMCYITCMKLGASVVLVVHKQNKLYNIRASLVAANICGPHKLTQ
jgi:hypothetical protein